MALRTLLLVALITIIWLNSSAGRVVSRKSLKQQIKKLKKDLNKAEANILNIQATVVQNGNEISNNNADISDNTDLIQANHQCPGNSTCSNQGTCDVPTGTCVCNSGFQGDMCQDLQCPGDGTCSYHGLCDVSTGTCDCLSGFLGDMCQDVQCPGDGTCSKQGTCDYSTGTCVCDSGFFGQTCVTTCTESMNYQVVEDRCYYFRNTYGHYEPQKQFCKTLFSGNGRLYEPPNLAALTKVIKVGSDKFNNGYRFIGIRDPYQNGTLTYTSNDLPIPFTIPFGGVDYANQDCVVIYVDIKWRRYCCSCNSKYAICEIAL